MIEPFDDIYFMKKAFQEAEVAYSKGEVPVGAVIVIDNKVIARGHNLTETLVDVTAHAEMQAITAAANTLGGKYLPQCTLYVTVEPCVMCAGAIVNARIERLVFGANDERFGAVETKFRLCDSPLLNHRVEIVSSILADDCRALMQNFFRARR
jgi:tRNA(adenine34) deaminase